MDKNLKVTNLVCVTYQANPALIPYHFVGKTQEEAMAKFEEWFNKKRPDPSPLPPANSQEVKDEDNGCAPADAPTPTAPASTVPASLAGRHANTGKLWMINHTTKERVRVPEDKVGEYVANGFEHGGPRTQFRS